MGLDPARDLALVKLKGAKGQPLPFASAGSLAVGDEVYAVGNPKGLEGTFSQGIVSSIRHDKQIDLIQITAPISHGSSGGPVLDDHGRVIGVAVGSLVEGQALNFCIPSSYLEPMIAKQKSLISLSTALQDFQAKSDQKQLDRTIGKPASGSGPAGPAGKPAGGPDSANQRAESSTLDMVGAPAPKRRAPPTLTDAAVEDSHSTAIPTTLGAITRLRLTITKVGGGRTSPITKVYTDDDGVFSTRVYSRRPAEPGFKGGAIAPDYLEIHFHGQNTRIDLEFTTFGIGVPITVGHFDGCQRAAFSQGTAGLDITAGTGYNTLVGNFDIYDVEFDSVTGHPRLVSFAAAFEQKAFASVIEGTIYLNAVPVAGLK
ncbi:MAG TPA: serine protease [Blastocatellia bacterium]|nr:serine protease [Blastocatellia bacterium]